MRRKKKMLNSRPAPVPVEYRSEICASCPIGCEHPFRLYGCPYGLFDEDEINDVLTAPTVDIKK